MVWDLPHQHLQRVPALMQQYAQLPMDLADASLVLLAEHLGHGRILSTDERDFETCRWKRHRPFDNFRHPVFGGSSNGTSGKRVDHFRAGLWVAEGLLG
jgi:hypothetical protein